MGKGIAVEAGTAILADAWDRLPDLRLHAVTDARNVASQSVLRRLGFTELRPIIVDDTDHTLWAINRPT